MKEDESIDKNLKIILWVSLSVIAAVIIYVCLKSTKVDNEYFPKWY
jgi:hypothetical protein